MDQLSLAQDDIKIWPHRLLHVPSMTSLERQPGNVYGSMKEPPYNVLSYTWGRWAIPSGSALSVQNVSWKIPAVHSARFTVAAFQHIIHQVASGVSHVWVDVACIDQANEAVKNDQIGKQAGIFNNAAKVYVWLHGTSAVQLQSFVDTILDLAERLEGDQFHEVNSTDDPECGFLIRYGADYYQPACVDEPSWSVSVASVVRDLLRDPWFSSLWTLQESFLVPNAELLSREGTQPVRRGYLGCGFANLIIALDRIRSAVGARLFQLRRQVSANSSGCNSAASAALQGSLRAVLDVLSPLALGAWESAPLLYHAAARRTTSNPADRVYGIMQVFGFCLGRAAEPHRCFTLAELEDQLGLALCDASPVLGQYFVHDEEPETGKAWRVGRSVQLPEMLRLVAVAPESRCEIRSDRPGGRPVFRGDCCSIGEMMECWKQMNTLEDDVGGLELWMVEGVVQVIALDASAELAQGLLGDLLDTEDYRFDTQQKLAEELIRVFGQGLMVFLLGHILEIADMVETSSEEDEGVDGEIDSGRRAENRGSVALIARQTMLPSGPAWQRMGICLWPHQMCAAGTGLPAFKHVEAVLA